ncbi:MAG TPA: hypothetical protein VN740_07630 [Solirubrobacteraceae bacterium]|nr:hypothetical protein [Solirubrobacteraceae bacterium]
MLVAALAAAPARAGDTRVLAIDGRSGAGKSTLAGAVAAALGAPLVSLEDLYGGWDGLEHGIALAASAVLGPLAGGRAAAVPRYDWREQRWAEPWPLEPPAALVLEGVGAGARELARYTSVLVWLELAEGARRERALHNRGDRELYAPHWERWARQEEAYIERERPRERADVVLALESLTPG